MVSVVVVVCNTRIRNATHRGAARDAGPVVLRDVRATSCYFMLEDHRLQSLWQAMKGFSSHNSTRPEQRGSTKWKTTQMVQLQYCYR